MLVMMPNETRIITRVAGVARIGCHSRISHPGIGCRALLSFENAVALVAKVAGRHAFAKTAHSVPLVSGISSLPQVSQVPGVSWVSSWISWVSLVSGVSAKVRGRSS